MNWGLLILLAVVLGGAAWVCSKLYGHESGTFSCIHCGECIAAGECVLKKKQQGKSAKKHAAVLDKDTKKDIITLLK